MRATDILWTTDKIKVISCDVNIFRKPHKYPIAEMVKLDVAISKKVR